MKKSTGELVKFTTEVVLPSSIAEKLPASTDKSREQMKAFAEKHLNIDETSFWDHGTSLKIKTFSNITKKTGITPTNEKFISGSPDRDRFGRLLMAANARQSNLREVLSYHLPTVQFAHGQQDRTRSR